MGVKFFNQYPADWSTYLYPNSAAVYLDVVPTDTAIWYFVSGSYTPDSAYTHMAIGNFFDDTLIDTTIIDTTMINMMYAKAYSFIDDVRVSVELSYCTSSVIDDPGHLRKFNVYPNPFGERLNIELPTDAVTGLTATLSDGVGRMVWSERLTSLTSTLAVPITGLENGLYVLNMYDAHGAYQPRTIVHVSP